MTAPRFVIGALALAWAFATSAQAQPATLTLACKGTTTDSSAPDAKQPFSTSIMLDFNARAVQGFGQSGLIDYPIRITAMNDVTIAFQGQHALSSSTLSIIGTIDRITGDLEATSQLYGEKERKVRSKTTYTLQCRPARLS